MYVAQDDGYVTLRQMRYRQRLLDGSEHPHDVCAMARTLDELKAMCEQRWPNVDYTSIKEIR